MILRVLEWTPRNGVDSHREAPGTLVSEVTILRALNDSNQARKCSAQHPKLRGKVAAHIDKAQW